MRKIGAILILLFVSASLFQNCSAGFYANKMGPLNDPEFSSSSSDRQLENLLGNRIEERKSLMIINHGLLDRLFDEGHLDVGVLLGRISQWQSQYIEGDGLRPGSYVRRIFSLMDAHQEREEEWYNRSPEAASTSHAEFRAVPSSKRMSEVIDLWEEKRQDEGRSPRFLNNITNVSDLSGGPFRILALVNRMDLAGDYDPRTQDEITRDPRSLGEFHIIFSLVSERYEQNNERPYPKVFALKYRLPPLRESGGRLRPNNSLDHKNVLNNESLWREQMQIWAKQWAGLSNHAFGSRDFNRKLEQIIRWSTRPKDFLSLQSNTQIYEGNGSNREFELASWYVFTGGAEQTNGRHIIPRALRREPFHCMDDSAALADIVDLYWDRQTQDLDMFTRDYTYGVDGQYEQYKAGYEILRDNYRHFMRAKAGWNRRSPASNKRYWRSGECGDVESAMPHMMHRDGVNSRNRVMMLPQTARIRAAGPSWSLNALRGDRDYEKKRHAFAIRTCTGCHSHEGATRGFHVSPRLRGENSKLSPFLTGNRERFSDVQAFTWLSNQVSKNGANYSYNELQDRKVWLHRFLNRQAAPMRSLLRPEMHR